MKKVLDGEESAARPAAAEARFTTISGRPIQPIYRPADVADLDYDRDLGDPGQYPYTRGIHETMYRGRLWTMRQFAGYGTAAQTNARFKYLLEHGGGGLSVAFDLPTLMGRDPDHPLSVGEVGKCGVAVSSLQDMETLFRRGSPARCRRTSSRSSSPRRSTSTRRARACGSSWT
jgi:methylmalonyl-CoA mutase N-terminal domain/subunit